MSELLLVNPRRRRGRARRRTRRRRHMTALQRQYFGGGRRRRRHRRSAALAGPVPATRSRRVGRRRRHRRGGFRRRAASYARGFSINTFLRDTLVPSGVGAAGALGVDLILGYLSPNLPTFMTTGIGAPLTKIAGAVGLGMAAQAITRNRRMAEQVMAGAITVVLYGYVKPMIQAQFPTLPLSGYGMYVGGMGYAGPALAYPDMSRMGMYVSSQQRISPGVAAAIAASRRVVQPSLGGVEEFSEGGYHY